MGAFVKQQGGYVVTTPHKQYASKKSVDQQTLLQIAELLGINKPGDQDTLKVESIRTIFVYAPDKS
jgi:hypothetical protein